MTKQEQIWKKFWKLYDNGEMTLNVAVISAMEELACIAFYHELDIDFMNYSTVEFQFWLKNINIIIE